MLDEVRQVDLGRLAALTRAGRYAELEASARAMLDRGSESGVVWQLLAVAQGKQGKEPLFALARAVQWLPDDAVAHLNLANALARGGRLTEALAAYERALALRPEFAEAHMNVGELLLELDRLEEAASSCRRAITLNPRSAEAHQILARVSARRGQFDEALISCRRALEISPEDAEAHNTLGNVLSKLARVDGAIESFRRALLSRPDFAEAWVNLANALRSIGRLDDAARGYRRALELKPQFIAAYTELATALRLQHRATESEATCRKALKLNPASAEALAVLAELRADAGRFADAQELLRRVISIDPQAPEAWAGLARMRRMTPADGEWLVAARRVTEAGHSPQRQLPLRYAIGKYFDDLNDFDSAFENYRVANEMAKRIGPPHDRRALAKSIDMIIRRHDRTWVSRERSAANPSTRPVFIVGMLRSGTTLTEQILASHPAVFGAGELTFWSAALAAAIDSASADEGRALDTSDAAVAQLANAYLELLQNRSPAALRVVNKLPTNFLCLGLIHAALPQARIIHMQRNPIDTCLSIYFQHFEAANTYANDLEDLANYHCEYRRLMQHWCGVLPAGSMLEMSYEALVENPEACSRQLVEFIDLPWDPRCLEFHRTERTVVTASKWQVRQRISRSSVERWRNYEKFVGPLKRLLESE